MRLDKYLKVSHIIKRRTVAKEAADKGKVIVNNKEAKPSLELKEGDIVTIKYSSRSLTFKVLSLNEHVSKSDSSSMYQVLENK